MYLYEYRYTGTDISSARKYFDEDFKISQRVSPIHFGFLYGGKRGPHTKHMGDRGALRARSRSESMFVLVLLSTIFWYVGPLKETKAKVTFLLILHPLSTIFKSLMGGLAKNMKAKKVEKPIKKV